MLDVNCLSFHSCQTVFVVSMVYLYIHLALQILFIMTYPALVKFLVVIRVRMFAIYLFVAKLLKCFDQNYLK